MEIVNLVMCPNTSPPLIATGHLSTKLCLSSIFPPSTKNAECTKASVTGGVSEGGGFYFIKVFLYVTISFYFSLSADFQSPILSVI